MKISKIQKRACWTNYLSLSFGNYHFIIGLDSKLANYSLWTQFSSVPVFISWHKATLISSYIIWLLLCCSDRIEELIQRSCSLQSLLIYNFWNYFKIYSLALYKKCLQTPVYIPAPSFILLFWNYILISFYFIYKYLILYLKR